jgi:hypothetical protein
MAASPPRCRMRASRFDWKSCKTFNSSSRRTPGPMTAVRVDAFAVAPVRPSTGIGGYGSRIGARLSGTTRSVHFAFRFSIAMTGCDCTPTVVARLDRAIQYAVASRFHSCRLRDTGSPAGACHRARRRRVRVAGDDIGLHFTAVPAVSINTSSRRTPGPLPRCALDRDDVADDLRITDAGGYGSPAFAGTTRECTATRSRRKTPELLIKDPLEIRGRRECRARDAPAASCVK